MLLKTKEYPTGINSLQAPKSFHFLYQRLNHVEGASSLSHYVIAYMLVKRISVYSPLMLFLSPLLKRVGSEFVEQLYANPKGKLVYVCDRHCI